MYDKSIIVWFWSKVRVAGPDECWEWQGAKNPDGYGNLKFDGKYDRAHRVSYLLENGEIPKGQCICHSCDNRACCNPKHLWLGTHLENMEDMTRKKRAWGTKLNEEMVLEMRKLYSEGYTLEKLGDKYGVGFQHVSRIINRICWKLVP